MGKIVLSQVRKSFGEVDVIPGIDLTIENGEFVVEMEPGEYVVGREDQPGNSMVTIVPGQTAVEVDIR